MLCPSAELVAGVTDPRLSPSLDRLSLAIFERRVTERCYWYVAPRWRAVGIPGIIPSVGLYWRWRAIMTHGLAACKTGLGGWSVVITADARRA